MQTLRDTTDAREQGFEEIAILSIGRAPTLQQVDLHQVHRVDVGIAQLDRTLQRRIRVEQGLAAFDREHVFACVRVFAAEVGKERVERSGREHVVRIRNFEIVGQAPEFASRQAFRVRETHNEILSQGRVNTLSSVRDNIHTLQAGREGARGMDISTYHGPDIGFSFLELENKPVDAEQRLFEAVWKQ